MRNIAHTMKKKTRGRLLSAPEIYAIRNELDLTQAQLADALGVSRRSVSNWENNHTILHRNFDLAIRELAKNGKEGAA